MFRSTLALSLVLLTGSVLGAAAQSPEEGVIFVPQGRAQSVPFKSLGGASVGNVVVAYIQHTRPDEVAIYGAVAGETWLELVGRDGRRKRLAVRVTPAAQPEARAASVAPKAAADTPAVEVAAQTHLSAAGPTGEPLAAARPSAATAAVPHRAAPAPPPVEAPRAGGSFWSRVEVAVNPVLIKDKEDVRVMSSETLKPGKLQEIAYAASEEKLATRSQHEQTLTVSRSVFIVPVNILYPLDEHNSLSVELPFIRREDEVKAGDSSVKTRGQGLGDVQLKFTREQPRLWKTAWDGTVELSVGLPTGKSIYNVRENQAPLGSGHYEIGGVAGASRIFDPFIVNAAGGVIYTLPRTVYGTRIAPGLGYVAQTGFGVVLNDKWLLSEEMNFTRRPNVLLSTPTDAQTVNTDQSYLKHNFMYRPSGGHTLQMTFGVGLNSASPDYSVGFRWVYRGGGRGR